MSKDKTDEEYFRMLYTIIPHRHPFIITSQEIFEYVTKLLKENKKEKKILKQLKEYYLNELYKKELKLEKMPKEVVDMYNIIEGNIKIKKSGDKE